RLAEHAAPHLQIPMRRVRVPPHRAVTDAKNGGQPLEERRAIDRRTTRVRPRDAPEERLEALPPPAHAAARRLRAEHAAPRRQPTFETAPVARDWFEKVQIR